MVGLVVLADTVLYAVLAPLLPGLDHSLHLTKLSAGLLVAAFPAGTLIGSIPGGLLVIRFGPRATVLIGLAGLALTSVAFGWLQSIAALDIARFAEGVASACSWAGGLAWVASATPSERRGAMMGRVLAAAVGGSLFGPVLGTIASAVGRGPSFTAFAVLVTALIPVTLSLPAPTGGEELVSRLLPALRRPQITLGVWVMTLPAIATGAVGLLGPLRLHRFGAGVVAIGATFLLAAVIEAAVSPLIGSLSDRRGRIVPLRAGLIGTTILVVCFTLPSSSLMLAVLIVVITGALALFWAPSMALLSEAAEQHGLHQGMAAALLNMAWAGGQIVGSAAGGALAKGAGDFLPMALTAALCAVTLVALGRARLG